MRIAMKTHFFLLSSVAVLATTFLTTSYAANTSEYLHFTRHRDSNGNLLMAPMQHQAEPSVMQKTVMPAQPKTFERRTTDWGMNAQEVKENEPIQPSWELRSPILADYEQRVAYHTEIEGIEAALTYTFYEDHLGRATYVFEPQHDDAMGYVQDFHTLKNWINQSYGSPTSVQEIWLDQLYQYDASLWGQAVQRGHLAMVAEWEKPGTDIVLMLNGGDDTVGLVADFTSTTFVVPVSFDTKANEENIEEMVDEATTEETVLPYSTEEAISEEVSVQDAFQENGANAGSQPETEVASQTPVNEMNELDEIEQMLNEEYPLNEPLEPAIQGGSGDSGMMNEGVIEEMPMEGVSEPQASVNSEAQTPESLDEHIIVDDVPILDEDVSPSVEPAGDAQVRENMPENALDVPKSEAVISEPGLDEQATNMLPIMDENVSPSVEPAGDAQVRENMPENASDEPKSETVTSTEPVVDEQVMDVPPMDEQAMEELLKDPAMDPEAKIEAKLDPQHL